MVIITIIAAFIKGFADIPAVGHAFAGVRACVCVLIFNAVVKLGKKSLINKTAIGVFVVILALALFTNLSPALLDYPGRSVRRSERYENDEGRQRGMIYLRLAWEFFKTGLFSRGRRSGYPAFPLRHVSQDRLVYSHRYFQHDRDFRVHSGAHGH